MRRFLLCALAFAASCSSCAPARRASESGTLPAPAPDRVVRVVWNQYKGDSGVFVMENLGGRSLVELRSKKLEGGERPVAYVPDDVMAEMFRSFVKEGWEDHVVPRPANPLQLGARGELTVIAPGGARHSLLRMTAQGASRDQVDAALAYSKCIRVFAAVWNAYPPQMQATTGSGEFGVRRAGDGEG